ncbi:fl(2)d-associated complex component-like isoform X1, partial [Vespula maculifrons]
MPAAGAAVPDVAEGAGQLGELDEPPEPRVRGPSGRAGLMKPLVVLALPGMYLFYKYSQYRREQRELSRRRVTERELQHLHHKIVAHSYCLFNNVAPNVENHEFGEVGYLKIWLT